MNNEHISPEKTTEEEKINGKGILISGGTTGIGRATAVLLAAKGAKVFIFGRHEQELKDALSDINATGGKGFGMVADQSIIEEVSNVIREAESSMGRIDILINNAGMGIGEIDKTEAEDIEYVVKSNLLGYMYCTKEAIKSISKNNGGHIVFIGSMSADERSGSPVYVATKSGIQGFAEATRKAYNDKGIKVTLIEPGSVGTDMPKESSARQREKEAASEMLKAEDIAASIHFCLIQPKRCDIVEMKIRPHLQVI